MCNHDYNDIKNTTILIDKNKFIGILQNPKIYRGICKECGKEFKFIKVNGEFKEVGDVRFN